MENKYKKAIEMHDAIVKDGYQGYISKIPTKAKIDAVFDSKDKDDINSLYSKLEGFAKKSEERAKYIEKIENIANEYRRYGDDEKADKLVDKKLYTSSLTALKRKAKRAEFSQNIYFSFTGRTPERQNLILKEKKLKELKNPARKEIKEEKKRTRKKRLVNKIVGFCGFSLMIGTGMVAVGAIALTIAVIKNAADNYDLYKIKKEVRNHRKKERENIEALELAIKKERENIRSGVTKVNANPTVEHKIEKKDAPLTESAHVTAEEEEKKSEVGLDTNVEDVHVTETPELKNEEVELLEELASGTTKPEHKEETELDELGVPKKEIKKDTVLNSEAQPIAQKAVISSVDKKENEVISELSKAAEMGIEAVSNLQGVDLSTKFLKSERDLTEYFLYKRYGQTPTSPSVLAVIELENSMTLLNGGDTKGNTRSM